MQNTSTSAIPPGLLNLIIIELLFLVLAAGIGLSLWAGLPLKFFDPVNTSLCALLVLSALHLRR